MVKAARPAVAEATRVDEPPFTPAGDAKLCKTLLMLLIAAALLSSGESVAFVSATRVPLRVRVPLFGTFEILRLELSFDAKRSTSFVRGARGLLILVVAIHEVRARVHVVWTRHKGSQDERDRVYLRVVWLMTKRTNRISF